VFQPHLFGAGQTSSNLNSQSCQIVMPWWLRGWEAGVAHRHRSLTRKIPVLISAGARWNWPVTGASSRVSC